MFPGAPAAAMCVGQWQTHYLRPDGDVAHSTWSYAGAGVTDYYEALDEATADDATSYCRVSVGSKAAQSSALTITFSNPTNPVYADKPVTLRMRTLLNTTGEGDNTIRWYWRLLQGGVEKDSWFYNQDTEGSWATQTRVLSSAVRASITDWTALRLEAKVLWTAGTSFEVDCDITWEEIEVHE